MRRLAIFFVLFFAVVSFGQETLAPTDMLFTEATTEVATDGSINSASVVLTSASNPFLITHVGRTVSVSGAGPGGATLETVILAFTNTGQVRVRKAASTTVSGIASIRVGTSGASSIDTLQNSLSGLDTNFAITNLTLTGNRDHGLGGNSLSIFGNTTSQVYLANEDPTNGGSSLTVTSTELQLAADSATFNVVGNTNNRIDTRVEYINLLSLTAGATAPAIRFNERTANGTNYVALKAPDALTGNTTYEWPTADGTSGQVLSTNGAGVWSWINAGSVATDALWNAKGDLAVGSAPDTAIRLPVGTNGQALVADSVEASGLKWAADFIRRDGTLAWTANQSLGSFKLINLGAPTNPGDAATKSYVDAVAAALDWKQSVRVATTAAGTLATDFENGDTIDGIVLATGNRILIKDQSSGIENGIYDVQASGAPVRSSDLAAASSASGAAMTVESGTANADKQFVCVNDSPNDVVGTDALVFSLFSNTAAAGTTASNVGVDGVGVFKTKVGDDLQFRNVAPATTSMTVVLNGDDIDLDIANNGVTYAKMQDVSAASRLLGRGSAAGAGDPQEITIGTNLTLAGTTLNAVGADGMIQGATQTGNFTATVNTLHPVNLSSATANIIVTFPSTPVAGDQFGFFVITASTTQGASAFVKAPFWCVEPATGSSIRGVSYTQKAGDGGNGYSLWLRSEMLIFRYDGTTWVVHQDERIPAIFVMTPANWTHTTSGSFVRVPFGSGDVASDNFGLDNNASNNVQIKRAGDYVMHSVASTSLNANKFLGVSVGKGAAVANLQGRIANAVATAIYATVTPTAINFAAAEVADWWVIQNDTATQSIVQNRQTIYEMVRGQGGGGGGGGSSAVMDEVILSPEHANIPLTNPGIPDVGHGIHHVIDYDPNTPESNTWGNLRCTNYQGGSIKADVYYTMETAATGNVVFTGELWAITALDAEDVDVPGFGTIVSVTNAVPSVAGRFKVATITFSTAGQLDSIASGDLFAFRFTRDASNASDTAGGDMEVRMIRLYE